MNSIVKRVLSGAAASGIALSGLALGAASVWWHGFCRIDGERGCWASVLRNGFDETDGEWLVGVGLVARVLRNRR